VDVVDGPLIQPGLLDTISWRDNLWLVPRWQRAKTEGLRQPVRIVRPHLFQFERAINSQAGEDYSLAVAIPKAVLDGQFSSQSATTFEIVEAPEVEIPIPKLQ
jgi:hypothetical protein